MKKLAVAEHNTDLSHQTMLNNTCILARKSQCTYWFRKEAVEIEMHLSMNQEDRFSLCRSW
jgi:hypothetical protein